MYIFFHKKAIALLITVFFIMLISISITLGLKYINQGANAVNEEQFLLQSTMILDDALTVLQKSKKLEQVTSAETMYNFLSNYKFISSESNGVKFIIELSSARSKVNPNILKNKINLELFKNFLKKKLINDIYADMLFDSMSKIKEDMTYKTGIFNDNSHMFRDYLSSMQHLEEINDYYMTSYHDSNLNNLDTEALFYFSPDTNSSIDLNFATAPTMEVILGCDELRAQEIVENNSLALSLEDLQLSDAEKISLSKFKTSFFEPYLDIKVEIEHNNKIAHIRFEYNITSKKGSNFVFEV